MSAQKAKFDLFRRLSELGFTYEESAQLRRIEMTLRRWAEAECNGEIQRDEWLDSNGPGEPMTAQQGKPFRVHGYMSAGGRWLKNRYPVADREAGALRRLREIVKTRNLRECGNPSKQIYEYHQSDPRGCALYLVRFCDIPAGAALESCYNRGLAVCA